MTTTKRAKPRKQDLQAAEQVVRHIATLIDAGRLRPGDQLPPERQLAEDVGVSRPTVRSGLQSLAGMGLVEARHGSGTYVTSGPPRLAAEPLGLLAALHGFTRDDMFAARRVLEVGVAALAAEHTSGDHLAAMAEELAGMFASLTDPQAFLVHDLRFHRAVGAGSRNPVLCALVDMVASLVWEQRRLTVERARDLKESAELHRRVYLAIRDKDPDRARREMGEHLDRARAAQASEDIEPLRLSDIVAARGNA